MRAAEAGLLPVVWAEARETDKRNGAGPSAIAGDWTGQNGRPAAFCCQRGNAEQQAKGYQRQQEVSDGN